jgi:hypothetical protein
LIELAPNVYAFEDTLRLPGGVVLPLRCTVLRRPEGLWVHSPVRFSGERGDDLRRLGPIGDLVAPSRMHHLFAGHDLGARRRWGPASLKEKRPDLDFQPLRPDAFGPDLSALPLEGAPAVDEWVFFHAPSGSLLVTDLFFHVLEPETWATAALMRLVGCHRRLAASRSWRWVFARDLPRLRTSLEAMLRWPITRVIPCHGAVAEVQPSDLRQALAVLLT